MQFIYMHIYIEKIHIELVIADECLVMIFEQSIYEIKSDRKNNIKDTSTSQLANMPKIFNVRYARTWLKMLSPLEGVSIIIVELVRADFLNIF